MANGFIVKMENELLDNLGYMVEYESGFLKGAIDVLDENGIRTGEVLSRKEIHKLGKIHRAVHLYLFDTKGNILLQRRSQTVDHYPGMFSISLTGHIDAGESSMQALKREIKEELGLNPKKMRLDFMFSYRRDAILNSSYIDRQFNDVYSCFHDFTVEDIKLDRQDLSEVKLISFAQFKQMVYADKSELAPVYGKACEDIVYFLSHSARL